MIHPLHTAWTLSGDNLPERLFTRPATTPDFHLPGADALAAFSALIGTAPQAGQEEDPLIPFSLPALLPDDVPGQVTLTRDVDFGRIPGDTALLTFDMLCGHGTLTLKSLPPRFGGAGTGEIALTASFSGGPLTLDVTDALRARRRFRLLLRFDDARPAGVCGPVLLRAASHAALKNVTVSPSDMKATLTVCADIHAIFAGDYALHAQLCPASAPDAPEDAAPIREVSLSLSAGETKSARFTMAAALDPFAAGRPYAAPGVKLWLIHRTAESGDTLCDSAVTMCGLPGKAPPFYLPLTREDMALPPEQLFETLTMLHVPGVSVPAPASDALCRKLTRAGIGVRQSSLIPSKDRARLMQYPCVTFDTPTAFAEASTASPALSAWQLCGLSVYPRMPEPGMTEAECLYGAAGREIDPDSADVFEVLSWLRALRIRLRAEALRQGKLQGPLCAPGEFRHTDVAQAIAAALAPLHLSAHPLCGAWWTGSHFSATLRAFIPRETLSVDKSLRAVASLEDAQGGVIARTEFPCAPWRSNAGIIEATLPDSPCALELVTRLYADDEVIEESVMPVYVGTRGMLEAAF